MPHRITIGCRSEIKQINNIIVIERVQIEQNDRKKMPIPRLWFSRSIIIYAPEVPHGLRDVHTSYTIAP